MREDVVVATAKASPPVAAMLFGLTLNDLVALATLAYLGLQALYLVWKWLRERRSEPT